MEAEEAERVLPKAEEHFFDAFDQMEIENENVVPKDADVTVLDNVQILSAIEIDMDDLSGEETSHRDEDKPFKIYDVPIDFFPGTQEEIKQTTNKKEERKSGPAATRDKKAVVSKPRKRRPKSAKKSKKKRRARRNPVPQTARRRSPRLLEKERMEAEKNTSREKKVKKRIQRNKRKR
jgi:hypothetical protein